MSKLCPKDYSTFRKLTNMSPAAIRAWARDPRAKCASFASTRSRLPKLAALKAKSGSAWTTADCQYARRVNSFNARMQGMVDKWGCSTRSVVALRNWGRMPRCPMPTSSCSTRPPRRA